jgi:hypothetical protein
VATAQQQVEELEKFLQRQSIVSMPASEPVVVAPVARVLSLGVCQHVDAGAVREAKPSRAYYYLTDVPPRLVARAAEGAPARLQHPDAVDHLDPRGLPGPLPALPALCARWNRRSASPTFFAPASFVEGWAHYCEHMMVEAGFRKGDTAFRLGQLAESLVRLARFVVGHPAALRRPLGGAGDALLPRRGVPRGGDRAREAERGTFDPTYLVYSAGKLMMLKLRHDYEEQQAGKYSLKGFHDAVLGNGCAPFWAHRQMLLGDSRRPSSSARSRRRCRSMSTNAGLRPPLRNHPEVLGRSARRVPEVRQGSAAAPAVVAGLSVQGHRLVRDRLRGKGKERREERGDSKPVGRKERGVHRGRQERHEEWATAPASTPAPKTD